MYQTYLITVFLFFLLGLSQTTYAQEPCGTDILHQQKLASDPIYKANFQKIQVNLQKHIAEKIANDAVSKTENTVYKIPVVVHVIEAETRVTPTNNLSNYEIRQAIKRVNENFRAVDGGIDIEIEFVLATRTPDCTPTTGINRIDASMIDKYVENGVTLGSRQGLTNQEVKALSIWSNTDYYNIWVVNKIDLAGGYSAFPGGDPKLDGVVITAFWFTHPTYPVLTHELGHSFFLYHTFHRAENGGRDSIDETDCPLNNDCTRQGDMVCDTDPHSRMGGVCGEQDCGSISPVTLSNYMSYCAYTNNFTPNQKTRMRTTAETLRPNLITSLGAEPLTEPLPTSACVPTNTGVKNNVGITRFVLDRLNIVSQDSRRESRNYLDIVCNQQLILDSNSEHNIKVETSSTPHNVKIYVDYNNDGNFKDEEEIASGNTAYSGNIQTFNAIYKVPYSNVLFNQPLRMRVVASATNDGIATACEVFNGQAEDYSLIINKVACSIDSIEIGAQSECNSETNMYSQSLIINYSNVPQTGNLIVNNQSFAITTSPQTITLTNLVADGKEVNIVASFLDDVSCQFIQNNVFTAPFNCVGTHKDLVVYPNPTPNEFSYSLNNDREGEHIIRVFDAIGKLIFEENRMKIGTSLEGIINLEKQAVGLYLLQISSSKNTTHVRIMKE